MTAPFEVRRVRHRYDVIETVGRGGQGTVVKALDTRHDRIVALKIRRLPPNPLDAERILAEVRTLLELPSHPGLPIARDDFYEGDHHVLVLDWVDGIDLGRVLAAEGTPGLPPSSVLRWAAQASEALTHLHRNDPPIVHGDVKPSNLVLNRHGRIVCVDFGVSSSPGRIQRGGTAGYRAPELGTAAPPTAAADVYGLAATVFALLSGEPPSGVLPAWHGLQPERARRIETALRGGLAIDPSRRPRSVGQLVESLRAGEPDTLPTGTVTVLSTSIAGAPSLWESRPLAMPGALARHDLIVDAVVERHGGRQISAPLEDGGTVSVFARAAQAVTAAVTLNNELVGACDPPIQVRAAAHTGELSGPDPQGPTVNRAAAIRAVAGPGQVLVSQLTATLVEAEQLDGITLVGLGAHHLEGFGSSGSEVIVAVAAVGLDVPPDPLIPPYPGLAPFSIDDADVYIGRDDAVTVLRGMLRPGRVVAVLGASGVGKSSLLRAGLLPHLPGATVCTPGSDPLSALPASGDGPIIVDQLEELIALCKDRAAQDAFVERVCAHLGGAVVALRADALADFTRFPRLAREIAAHHLLLTPMRPDQLRAAIEQPAAQRGLQLEPGLVELVLAETGEAPGSLPLVAHAMRETWTRRNGRLLTVAGYQASGGVHGAIAASAEAVFDDILNDDRDTMRSVLLRMVQPGEGNVDTRRRVELDELRQLGGPEATERVIERLVAARLLTLDGHSVQPAHDALLRAWPRLADWVAEQREDLRRQRHLTSAARAWTQNNHDPGELYRGARLHTALELAERSAMTDTERAFIEASALAGAQEEQHMVRVNQRLRAMLLGVAVALVVALCATVVAVIQLDRASAQRDRADSASERADITRLAAEARAAARTEPDLALLLAVEASRRSDTPETHSALLETVAEHPQLAAKLHGVNSGLEAIAWSPDATMVAAPTSDSTGTRLWDGTSFRQLGEPLASGESFRLDFDAVFTPDARTLVVAGVVEKRGERGPESVVASLQAWDVATRDLRVTIPLGVLPDHVVAVDNTHVVVVGRPMPTDFSVAELESVLVTQRVDLTTGSAGPRQTLAREPLATTTAGTTVLSLSTARLLSVSDVADAAGATVRSVDVSALLGHDAFPGVLGYDPTRGRLAIGTEFGEVLLAEFDPTSPPGTAAVLIRRISTEGDPPSAITFSPDGSLVAVGGYLGSTRLWNSATGLAHGPPLAGFSGQINDLSFSPDAARLAVAGLDGTGSIWNLDGARPTGHPITGHRNAVVATMATPDGRTFITAGFDGSVLARATDSGEPLWSTDTGQPIWSAAIDPGGTRIATGGANGQVLVLDVADGSAVQEPTRFGEAVEALAWSPTEPLIAVAADQSADRLLHELVFLDAKTLRRSGDAVGIAAGSAISLAFSRDGLRLAAVLDNNVVRVVDVAGRSLEERYLESVDVPFFAVAWAPQGNRIATGTSGGTVQLWDAATLEPAAPAGRQSPIPVRGLAFSPDGTVLASTTEFATTRLWSAATGAPIGGDLVAGAAPITIAAIPEPERPEIPFTPSFSTNGLLLFTGGDHPMVWSLDPAAWRDAACAIAGRELTPHEWALYLPGQRARRTCARGPRAQANDSPTRRSHS